ncbi:MAG TPA: VOC family protein [Thermoanaerobaculia bacterium]|nr:VOC family protein [Thermoanaerobaculia bacterium]
MPFSVTQIDHVEVLVRDLAAAQRWYGEVLGLAERRRWDPEPVMIGREDGPALALFQAGEGRPATGEAPRWHRVAWRTDALGFAAAQEHLRALGIPFRGPIDHDIAESIYFQDPDGNPLEITFYR